MTGVSAGIDELSSQGILEGEGFHLFPSFAGFGSTGKTEGTGKNGTRQLSLFLLQLPPPR